MSVGLQPGSIVHVRSRQYLVEDVVPPPSPRDSQLVRLSCLEDDALGEALTVLWDHEIDARVLGANSWQPVTERGFDEPRHFSAYLHTLRWNCVTSTDPKLFQAPYRAGIEVKAYQLEPLRKALAMPRVNLFIADDVGLGKTIEAGLILRELLLRQKVRRVVVACPSSVVDQWREEMEERFGLPFVVFDRAYVTARRQERGFGVNAWTTHSRFIISHALLRDETYAAPLRDWLTDDHGQSMLILDEAHNFAPASGSRYAIDSKLTKTARELAGLFEHKLFLSATPHNGHSNSFSALLEILDPQRFCRGVPIKSPKLLDEVLVRRLKKDLRGVTDDFPEREVEAIAIDGLPDDAPELRLSELLQRYRRARERRAAGLSKSQRAAAMLVVTSLQKRLLSSIEAFARTLEVHRNAIERQATVSEAAPAEQQALLFEPPGADDERAELDEAQVGKEEDGQVESVTRQGGNPGDEERALLREMAEIAGHARGEPDSRFKHFVGWIRANLCPDLGRPGARWLPRRVLVFTEYTDTKDWLVRQLREALDDSDLADERVATFHGGGDMGKEKRKAVKAAFNADPDKHPLRILVATDAAREGVNLQNHCADLFHFDVPWNPSRMEQRNGRIDRKLQRAKVVHCRYFVLPQRAEDRVLEVLVQKTKIIHEQLGSLPPVVERKLSHVFEGGIRHEEVEDLRTAIERADKSAKGEAASTQVIEEELEEVRQRQEKLGAQVGQLDKLLDESRRWLQLDDGHFREALSASLELLGAPGLQPLDPAVALRDPARARWVLPDATALSADPTWAATLDTLRPPKPKVEKVAEWRARAPIRPLVFRDPGTLDGEVVHLHLEHRIVQRLLGRFLAQGFLHHEIRRACVLRTESAVPAIVVLGRLSLYGDRASRLHDELIAVAAEWTPPDTRGRGKLKALPEGEKEEMLRLVEHSLGSAHLRDVPQTLGERFRQGAARDVEELLPALERRAKAVEARAQKKLQERGQREAADLKALLASQRDRIVKRQREVEDDRQLALGFGKEEARQLEADKRHWKRRLADLAAETAREPGRVQAAYDVKASRIEPAGLVYLWPLSS